MIILRGGHVQLVFLHLVISVILRALLILLQHLVEILTGITFGTPHVIPILFVVVVQVGICKYVISDGLLLFVLCYLLLLDLMITFLFRFHFFILLLL